MPVSQDGDDVLVRVRAQPRARATEVAGVPQSRAELVRGATARDKLLRLRGADAAAVASRLCVA